MKRFFIYGGCVSRDTFELVKSEHVLSGYVARQSLISATSMPESRISITKLEQKFSPRMVAGDIASSLFPSIRAKSNTTDVFLFDILSERLGVYRLQGGRFITNSAELSKLGLLDEFHYAKAIIHFGTSRHLELWKQSALKFKELLVQQGIFEKSYFIETIWTERTIQGNSVPHFRNWSADHANILYVPYFDYLNQLGFKSHKPDASISNSDDNHKWGASPYHYQNEYYQDIINGLLKE